MFILAVLLLAAVSSTTAASAHQILYRTLPNGDTQPVLLLRNGAQVEDEGTLDSDEVFKNALKLVKTTKPGIESSRDSPKWGLFQGNTETIIQKVPGKETIIHHHYLPVNPKPTQPYPPPFFNNRPISPFATYPPYGQYGQAQYPRPPMYPYSPYGQQSYGPYQQNWNGFGGYGNYGNGIPNYPYMGSPYGSHNHHYSPYQQYYHHDDDNDRYRGKNEVDDYRGEAVQDTSDFTVEDSSPLDDNSNDVVKKFYRMPKYPTRPFVRYE